MAGIAARAAIDVGMVASAEIILHMYTIIYLSVIKHYLACQVAPAQFLVLGLYIDDLSPELALQ